MLKHIPLSDLELGMFVEKMDGGWFDHPFWKAKFLIEDESKLNVLKSSKLAGVIIDTSKGRDVPGKSGRERHQRPPAATDSSGRIGVIKARVAAQQRPPEPVSTDKEVHTAQVIAGKAKEQMRKLFLSARLGKALNVRMVEPVVGDILTSVKRNPQAFGGLMRCKLRNEAIYEHSLAVSALMVSLANQMKRPEHEVREAGLAGLLLDVGTNYLPQNLEPANGDYRNLDPKIWEQHPTLGYRSIIDDDALPDSVLEAVLKHHERIDGTGFPRGLKGDEIGRIARMAAICDTFDHLLVETESTKALDPASAIEKLKTMEGAFDQDILRSFIESVGLYPVGSFVHLRSDRLAMVIDEDPAKGVKPTVIAFFCCRTKERIQEHKIALAKHDCEDEIIDVADLSGFDLPEDSQLRDLLFLRAYNMDV